MKTYTYSIELHDFDPWRFVWSFLLGAAAALLISLVFQFTTSERPVRNQRINENPMLQSAPNWSVSLSAPEPLKSFWSVQPWERRQGL